MFCVRGFGFSLAFRRLSPLSNGWQRIESKRQPFDNRWVLPALSNSWLIFMGVLNLEASDFASRLIMQVLYRD